jgi:toxin ParE1/3/4
VKPVLFTKLAQSEVDRAAEWFESRKEGLGEQFYRRVDEAAGTIETAPEAFQKIYKDMRRVGLSQFTEWGIFYRVLPKNSVVIACASGKRHPRLSQERALGIVEIRKPPEPS